MPLALRSAGDHPEIGVQVDSRGIAFDVQTGRPLARKEVDQRVAQYQASNPGVQVAGLDKKRGGVAGVFDRNKKVILPAAALLGATMIPGVGGALASGVRKLGGLAKTAGKTLLGGASGGDLLKAGLGAIPALDAYNRSKRFENTANQQVNKASSGNDAMMEIAKALIARGGATPTTGPDLSHLIDDRNPYAKQLRPRIAEPVNDPAAVAPLGAGVTATPGAMYDPSTFGGLKPGRGMQSGASVAAMPGATYDAGTFGGLKRPLTPLGASVTATPGATYDPVAFGGAKRPPTLLGASVSGMMRLPPGASMYGSGKSPLTPGAAAVPASVPNFDPKTHQEIKSWDTEALRKTRPKPPLIFHELLPDE